MHLRFRHTAVRTAVGAVVAVSAAAALSLVPSTASADAHQLPTTAKVATSNPALVGLFGAQDPTWDGVYRQGLSLIALDAAGARIPASSVRWLLRQQCDNGRFMSYRADVSASCGFYDSNATAMAAIALKAVGERRAARDAVDWLITEQLPSGGWRFSNEWGGKADANSTGLVVQALIALDLDPTQVATKSSGPEFLAGLQLGCTATPAEQGALAFQSSTPLVANDFATAQATAAFAGSSLPVKARDLSLELPAPSCPARISATSGPAYAAGYLGRVLNANDGTIPYAGTTTADYGSTANAVLSMVAAGYGAEQVSAAMGQLGAAAATYSRDDQGVVPASAAALALTAYATAGNPRSVGETNPIRDILGSRTLAG